MFCSWFGFLKIVLKPLRLSPVENHCFKPMCFANGFSSGLGGVTFWVSPLACMKEQKSDQHEKSNPLPVVAYPLCLLYTNGNYLPVMVASICWLNVTLSKNQDFAVLHIRTERVCCERLAFSHCSRH